jgi:SNF2 family DNA or RNA helicase
MTTLTATVAQRGSLEPYIPDSVEYYWWQVEGVRLACRILNPIFGDDMGLGKSLQALTTFAVDVKMGKASSALVVCPATLKANWADEVEKFTTFSYDVLGVDHDESGKTKVLTPSQRKKQLADFAAWDEPRIMICNYEQVTAHLDLLNELCFDVVILDEAHFVKNHRAQRTKAVHRLRAKRFFLLTASLMLNHVDDLWSPLKLTDPRGVPGYWQFLNRYAVFGGYKDKQIVAVKNERELRDRLDTTMIRRLARDCLSLEEPQIIPRLVDLHPEQRKLYDEICADMRLTTSDSTVPLDIDNALTKFLKLKQICGTTATVLGLEKDYSYKLDLAIEDDLMLLDQDEKIVVFTQFRGVQEAYLRRFVTAVPCVPHFVLNGDVPLTDRVPTIKNWENTSGAAVIVCMLQVAGVGINMAAAHHGSMLDKLFVPKLNDQAIGRLNRLGQTKPVQIREYRVRGTVETRVEQILKSKDKRFADLIEMGDYRSLVHRIMRELEPR